MRNLLLFTLLGVLLYSCSETNHTEQALKLYKQAQKNLDATTSKVALNQLIMLDSTNLVYKDSLARLYMQTGNYKAGSKLADEVIAKGNPDTKLMEMAALSYQQLGDGVKAETLIDMLLANTNNSKYLYQKMVLQSEKGDLIMFDSLSNRLLQKIDADSLIARTTVSLPDPTTGADQQVPLKAATYFVIGNNAFEKEQNLNKAVEYFKKSVEEFDNFLMARYYLTEIARMQQQGAFR